MLAYPEVLLRATSVSDWRSLARHLTAEGNGFLDRTDILARQHEKRLIQKVGLRAATSR
jgi:hypothetical protein